MLVRDAMNKDIRVVSPETTLIEVARLMRDGDFGILPVCEAGDAQGKLVGMITDRDITVRAVASGRLLSEACAKDAMTKAHITCDVDDDLEEAVQIMADHQVRRLAVLDESEKLVGILSVGDVAIMNQDQAAEALGGIAEHRHDEPWRSTSPSSR